MKKLIEILKVIKNNKRYKAILTLSLYGLLFMIIIILAKINPKEVEKILTIEEVYGNLSNYNIEIIINKDEVEENIIGSCNDECELYYNDSVYLIDSSFEDSKDLVIDIDMNEISINYIYNIINTATLISTTNVISTNEIINNYEVENILLSTYELENTIYKVKIDYKNTVENYNSYIITIIYS